MESHLESYLADRWAAISLEEKEDTELDYAQEAEGESPFEYNLCYWVIPYQEDNPLQCYAPGIGLSLAPSERSGHKRRPKGSIESSLHFPVLS